jgi:hypothetical protein
MGFLALNGGYAELNQETVHLLIKFNYDNFSIWAVVETVSTQ